MYKYNTPAEKTARIFHSCDRFSFESCVNLSQGVKITPLVDGDESDKPVKVKRDHLIADVAQFTLWWTLNIYPELNGFSGIDTIVWNLPPNVEVI